MARFAARLALLLALPCVGGGAEVIAEAEVTSMNKGGSAALLIGAITVFLLIAGARAGAFLFLYGAFFLLFIYLGVRGPRWWLFPAGLQLSLALLAIWAASQGH